MTTSPSRALERRQPSWTWQVGRLLLAGSRDQAFLDHRWVGGLLDALPATARYPVAVRILGLSPHYFINQWTSAYPAPTRRSAVLDAEMERNRESRRQIVDNLLAPHLRPGMTVLDFGCGPGFLARQISSHVGSVVAVDISRGTIACARHLNPAANVSYLNNRSSDLALVPDESIDLAISFAVFQHLGADTSLRFLEEFRRVLRPGATAICQFAVANSPEDSEARGAPSPAQRAARAAASPAQRAARAHGVPAFLDRYRLNFRTYSEAELHALVGKAGFEDATIGPVRDVADISDDVGTQHLVVFRRPPEP